MSSISRLNISNTLYEISPDGILDNTKYVSNDKSNTTEYINGYDLFGDGIIYILNE